MLGNAVVLKIGCESDEGWVTIRGIDPYRPELGGASFRQNAVSDTRAGPERAAGADARQPCGRRVPRAADQA